MSHARDLTLAIDVGTGSARAALVDATGRILAIAAREYEQIVPAFGWSEQRPADWWAGVVASIWDVLGQVDGATARVSAIAACGQMHGTVLIDQAGRLTRETAPLWNDKRTASLVSAFEAVNAPADYLARTGNPPTSAWPAFKLMWIRDNDPARLCKRALNVDAEDYVNFRLTGEIAMDRTEAAASFLMDPRTGDWSAQTIALLDLDRDKLPPIRQPTEILGRLSIEAAAQTGLLSGTPVLVGGGDYPVALLGPARAVQGWDRMSQARLASSRRSSRRPCSTRRSVTSERSRAPGGPSSCWKPAGTRCVGLAARFTRRRSLMTRLSSRPPRRRRDRIVYSSCRIWLANGSARAATHVHSSSELERRTGLHTCIAPSSRV